MIKLNDVVVCGVSHVNIFWGKSGLDCIDVVLSIDYNVDADSVDLDEYGLSCEDMSPKALKQEFASYMVVVLEEKDLDNIENMSYEDLKYIIQSDVTPDVEEAGNRISDEELDKAYDLIKEYLMSDAFKEYYNNARGYSA